MRPSKTRRWKHLFLGCALSLACHIATWAKAPSIHATLDQNEISFGDSAQLTVTINGRTAGAPNLPAVPGLSFDPISQSSQIQVINGAMSATVAHTFLVTPDHPGTFTIPPVKVGDGPDAGESNPLVLKVLKRSGAAPASPGANPGGNLPAPTVKGSDDPPPSPGRNAIGFLQVVMPKKEFYVGEMVPVELKACFRAGVELRVDGLPQLNSDAFTMNKLAAQPARGQELIDGEPFNILTWPTTITAVKAGDYDLSVEIPTTVIVRQRAARPRSPFGDSFFDDAFNDPFFSQFFGTATQKQLKLNSAGTGVRILPLPAEGRPAGFAGAVGRFDFAATATPSRLAAGDPVTLRLKVAGCGNFDRVTAPAIESTDTWKTYPPGVHFEAADSAGFEGTKTFEMALIPKRSGRLEVPVREFSYFDPEQRRYVTKSVEPMAAEVANEVGSGTPPATDREPDKAGVPGTAASEGMAVNATDAGTFTSSLRPWFLNPGLVALAFVPLPLSTAALLLIRRREKRAGDPFRLRGQATQRAVREQLIAMEAAAGRGETGRFFTAARAAIQHQLGHLWNLPPETITLAEVNSRMNGEADGFRELFEIADEVTYTGRTFGAGELTAWIQTVNAELGRLEARCRPS